MTVKEIMEVLRDMPLEASAVIYVSTYGDLHLANIRDIRNMSREEVAVEGLTPHSLVLFSAER